MHLCLWAKLSWTRPPRCPAQPSVTNVDRFKLKQRRLGRFGMCCAEELLSSSIVPAFLMPKCPVRLSLSTHPSFPPSQVGVAWERYLGIVPAGRLGLLLAIPSPSFCPGQSSLMSAAMPAGHGGIPSSAVLSRIAPGGEKALEGHTPGTGLGPSPRSHIWCLVSVDQGVFPSDPPWKQPRSTTQAWARRHLLQPLTSPSSARVS